MKKLSVLLITILTINLSGCGLFNKDIELYIDDELHSKVDLSEEQNYILPILDNNKDKIFVGWKDESGFVSNTYTGDNTKLYAEFQTFDQLFDYEDYTFEDSVEYSEYNQEKIVLSKYKGNGTYLKIPQFINDKLVYSMKTGLFKESTLEDIVIPIDLQIADGAFIDSKELKSITFHGQSKLMTIRLLPQQTYDEIIASTSETCIINAETVTETSWEFNEDCQIARVLSKEEITVEGNIYTSYKVLLRDFERQLYLYEHVFLGTQNLETVEIPDNCQVFQASFIDSPKLKTFIVSDEHITFQFKDGILYSNDFKKIEIYTNSLQVKEFIIPDTVEDIGYLAFKGNTMISSITLGKGIETVGMLSDLQSLEEIKVSEDNPTYTSIDDLLYRTSYQDKTLVVFPVNKNLKSFTIPTDVTEISPYAFSNNKHLETIEITEGVEVIGRFAFYNTEKLKELDIPNTVKFIQEYIVQDSSIESIVLRLNHNTRSYSPMWFRATDKDKTLIYILDDLYETYMESSLFTENKDYVYKLSEYAK